MKFEASKSLACSIILFSSLFFVTDNVVRLGVIQSGHNYALDADWSNGKPPREVSVGVYIQKALWEVPIIIQQYSKHPEGD